MKLKLTFILLLLAGIFSIQAMELDDDRQGEKRKRGEFSFEQNKKAKEENSKNAVKLEISISELTLNETLKKKATLQVLKDLIESESSEHAFSVYNSLIDELKELVKKQLNESVNYTSGDTFFHYARTPGHVEVLLKLGAGINKQNKYGQSPLLKMLIEGNNQAANYFWNQLADSDKASLLKKVDHLGNIIFHAAARSGNIEMITDLLSRHDVPINAQTRTGRTALMHAVVNGHKEIVQMLVARQDIQINIQDLYRYTALILAVENGHKEIIEMLLSRQDIQLNLQNIFGYIALMRVCMMGHKEIVQMLLDHGADVNAQNRNGWTALMYAVLKGHKEIVYILLSRQNIQVNLQDEASRTALIHAVDNGHEEIVKILLSRRDVRVNLQDFAGWTALICAVVKDCKEMVKMILDAGADVNAQDKFGETALMSAAANGNKEIVQMLLLRQDIQLNLQGRNGRTALSWAAAKGHKEIVELLSKHS